MAAAFSAIILPTLKAPSLFPPLPSKPFSLGLKDNYYSCYEKELNLNGKADQQKGCKSQETDPRSFKDQRHSRVSQTERFPQRQAEP